MHNTPSYVVALLDAYHLCSALLFFSISMLMQPFLHFSAMLQLDGKAE